jgi:hypothetical protein
VIIIGLIGKIIRDDAETMTEVAGATHASGGRKENVEIERHNLLHFWMSPVCYPHWGCYC